MASRPQGTQSYTFNGTSAADTVIKAAGGKLYSFNIQWSNGNVGDQIHIHDSATADASATKKFTFQFPTTAGSFAAILPAVGKEFLNGMWLNYQLLGPTVNIDIGFD